MLRNIASIAFVGFVAFVSFGAVTHAQAPHIYGSWELDTEASEYPGPMPQTQVRTYYPAEDGYFVGLTVTVDARGNASFLQIAARTDGQDYPEYDAGSLARLQRSGARTTATYSETRLDEYTVEWVDANEGEPYLTGTRRVSRDGRTLTIEAHDPAQPDDAFTLVYDKL